MPDSINALLPDKFAIRGILANIQAGLALKFQFNPTNISFTKAVNYSVEEIPGWDHPDIAWESGGIQKIKLDLIFDRTQGSVDSNYAAIGLPLIGVQAVQAVMTSFLYPQHSALDFIVKPVLYKAPPRGVFILGLRWWDVIIEGDQEVNEILFDKLMTPLRTTFPLSMIVVEEGTLNQINRTKRHALALAAGAIAIADTVSETFNLANQ